MAQTGVSVLLPRRNALEVRCNSTYSYSWPITDMSWVYNPRSARLSYAVRDRVCSLQSVYTHYNNYTVQSVYTHYNNYTVQSVYTHYNNYTVIEAVMFARFGYFWTPLT